MKDYDVVLSRVNCSYLHIKCEKYIIQELYEVFQAQDPNSKWHPLVKKGLWDGKIRYINYKDKTIPIGLKDRLCEYLDNNGYSHNTIEHYGIDVTVDEIITFADSLNLNAHGERITLRDYQLDAIHKSLTKGRLTLESATSSGKSLILYIIVRYLLRHELVDKFLLIVPTVQLVKQMYNDFDMYSRNNDWDVNDNCHTISAGKDKNSNCPIYISTWQSLTNSKFVDTEYFYQFDAVIVDEVHLAKGKSINNIVNSCINAKLKIGVSGSLSDKEIDRLTIEGAFGKNYLIVTAAELIEKGVSANLNIINLIFEYPMETRKFLRERVSKKDDSNIKDLDGKAVYDQELSYIVSNHARNKYIKNLALSLKGNTLILYQFVEKHGNVLDEIFRDSIKNERKYFYIHGKIDVDVREGMRQIVESENDAIILASYQTLSTGTNIRNIHNIIFASPTKSKIRVIQSIGRGLRTSSTKSKLDLYDLGDDLSYKKKPNITLQHLIERIEVYNNQGFNFKSFRIPLKNG